MERYSNDNPTIFIWPPVEPDVLVREVLCQFCSVNVVAELNVLAREAL